MKKALLFLPLLFLSSFAFAADIEPGFYPPDVYEASTGVGIGDTLVSIEAFETLDAPESIEANYTCYLIPDKIVLSGEIRGTGNPKPSESLCSSPKNNNIYFEAPT